MLNKATVETALNAELDAHIGYRLRKHQISDGANSRNCYSNKVFKTEEGEFKIDVPRDRDSRETQLQNKVFGLMVLIDTNH